MVSRRVLPGSIDFLSETMTKEVKSRHRRKKLDKKDMKYRNSIIREIEIPDTYDPRDYDGWGEGDDDCD